jgi:hypothetical protein
MRGCDACTGWQQSRWVGTVVCHDEDDVVPIHLKHVCGFHLSVEIGRLDSTRLDSMSSSFVALLLPRFLRSRLRLARDDLDSRHSDRAFIAVKLCILQIQRPHAITEAIV